MYVNIQVHTHTIYLSIFTCNVFFVHTLLLLKVTKLQVGFPANPKARRLLARQVFEN